MNLQDDLQETKQPPGIWNAGGCFYSGPDRGSDRPAKS
jgi:hypothetical protein